MKKKTLTAVAVLASIIAGASVLAVAETKTHFLSEMFEQEQVSNGKLEVAFDEMVTEETSKKDTLKQEIEINDENSPFEEMTLNYHLYGDEETPASISIIDGGILLDHVSKVEITMSLKEDVEFFISNMVLLGGYTNEKGELLEDVLDVEIKVGRKVFDSYTNAEQYIFMNNNAVSGDVVITIKNVRADEEKNSAFYLKGLTFNVLDTDAWAPEVEEETEEE